MSINRNTLFYLRSRRPEFDLNATRAQRIADIMNEAIDEHDSSQLERVAARIARRSLNSSNVIQTAECGHYVPHSRMLHCTFTGNTMCRSTDCYETLDIDGESLYYASGIDPHSHIQTCDNCGIWTRNGEYCASCEDNNDNSSSDRLIYGYHDTEAHQILPWYPVKPDSHYHANKKLPYLGFELEVEVSGNVRDAAESVKEAVGQHAILMEDGTIESGFEIISSPHTIAEHYKAPWARILNGRVDGMHAGEDHIGLHVNLNRASLSQLEVGKMHYFLHKHYGLFEALARRGETSWQRYAKGIRKIDPCVVRRGSGSHYDAVNVKDDRLEFRIFRSTLTDLFFYGSLETVLALREFTHVASLREMQDTRGFLAVCDSSGYPALREYIRHLKLVPAAKTRPTLQTSPSKRPPVPVFNRRTEVRA